MNGLTVIGYAEIEAWSQLVEVPRWPWLSILLHTLSGEYAAQANASSDPKCQEPNYSEETMRQEADAKLRKMFRNG